MAISTYGELKTACANWLQRSDLTAHIPDFVTMATARFSDELRASEMETLATATVTGEWSSLPTDFREIRLMEANGEVFEYRTPWQLQKLVETKAARRVPVYSIQSNRFRVYPYPTGASVELTYYAALPAFANDAATNWLLTKRPDVYLYGAIAQARMFLHDDQRLVAAQAFTDKYIQEAARASKRMQIGGAPLAVRAN